MDLAHPPLTKRALGSVWVIIQAFLAWQGRIKYRPGYTPWTPRVSMSSQNGVLISTENCLFPRIPCPGPGPAQLTVHLDPDPLGWPFTWICPAISLSGSGPIQADPFTWRWRPWGGNATPPFWFEFPALPVSPLQYIYTQNIISSFLWARICFLLFIRYFYELGIRI